MCPSVFLGKIAFSNEICMAYVKKMCIKCVICLGELHIFCSKVCFYQGNRVSALFGMDKLHQMCDLSRGITHLLFKSEPLPGKSCFLIILYG